MAKLEAEIDPYPVSELTTRFGIGKTALYARLKALGIVPMKQGGKAFVSQEPLQRLEALDEHLKAGGTLANFEHVQRTSDESGEQDKRTDPVVSHTATGKPSHAEGGDGPLGFFRMDVQSVAVLVVNLAVRGIKEVLLAIFPAPLSRTERGLRLSPLRELEEAYEKRWLLSTTEVSDLLGLSATTVRAYGEQFEHAGFTFTRSRVSTRERGQLAWKVGKLKALDDAIDVATTTLD